MRHSPANPASGQEKVIPRIPMSLPQLKLSVPDIPGYHLHWMVGTASRIKQAQAAGYEFVDSDEIDIPNTGLADDASSSGNTDLGSRVSALAGNSVGEDGSASRLYLMKLKQEWWEEDQKLVEARNEQVAASLRGTGQGENRYIPASHKDAVANIFTPKHRRA